MHFIHPSSNRLYSQALVTGIAITAPVPGFTGSGDRTSISRNDITKWRSLGCSNPPLLVKFTNLASPFHLAKESPCRKIPYHRHSEHACTTRFHNGRKILSYKRLQTIYRPHAASFVKPHVIQYLRQWGL